jgi:redox-sensitive bicupin YhaK (pirin superfamily)
MQTMPVSPEPANTRRVARVVRSITTREGAGFVVNRPFPREGFDHFDPFLLLDELGPTELGPGEAKGAPDHPHRGFETVTYLLAGGVQHRDSVGNAGTLLPGDVQWMTAGSGVVHSELPSDDLLARGGRMHGFQLWVNLPRRDKMIAPRYQDTTSALIPVATSEDGLGRVKVIAGEALGKSAVIDTRTPMLYHHWSLQPGARVEVPLPRDFNVFAYVFDGQALVAGESVGRGHAALLTEDGPNVTLAASTEPAELLLIGGQPLGEPVARYGPFVMNTRAEIVQAFEDYQHGRMGRIH